ncbi:hypothetical protein [Streptomyces sp. NPDC017991]|uniref:glutamine amidotransferase-related protein n=1 Tax=Streptomyces sp. NPDC017991 TaxID=3365026 RepID=UPI0037B7133C
MHAIRTHFIVHESFEGPGAFEEWADARDHDMSHSRLYEGGELPSSVDGIDLLIVMGGPQRTGTTVEECGHFDAAAERALIASAAAADKAVVGVCLGAQLIGEALGAATEPSPYKEIGVFPATLTADGQRHPFFAGFEKTFPAGHWHNEMPGLTDTARVLATSAGCPRQIVAYGRRVYGLQCHMEFTPSLVEQLIGSSEGAWDDTSAGRPFVQQPAELRDNDFTGMNDRLGTFLDRLVSDIPPLGSRARR